VLFGDLREPVKGISGIVNLEMLPDIRRYTQKPVPQMSSRRRKDFSAVGEK